MDKGFAQYLLPLLVAAASTNQLLEGASNDEKEFNKEFLYVTKGLAELYIPGLSQDESLIRDYDRKGFFGLLSSRANQFVPFSGALKSIRRTQARTDNRNSDAAWWHNNPFYLVEGAEGVIIKENVLGEELRQANTVSDKASNVLRGLGLPFYWTVSDTGRDPVKKAVMDEFRARNYRGGNVDIPDFKKLVEKNDREYNAELLKSYREIRVREFLRNYQDNLEREPDY